MKIFKDISNTIGEGAILFAATFLVNIGNYGLNLFLGRWLGPEGFSEANMIATLVMVLSFAAMGLQLTVAKLAAEDQKGILVLLKKKVSHIVIALTVVLLIASYSISSFLQFSTKSALAILFLGLPFYFFMSFSRGYYQGATAFKSLAMTYLIEMFVRVVLTIGLLYLCHGTGWESDLVSVGFVLSFFCTYLWSKVELPELDTAKISLQSVLPFLGVIAIYELSQIMINNSDVILVKHFFTAHEAGLYASMALLGRAVFFATWTVVTILFPKVIEKERSGQPHVALFYYALLVVGVIGMVMVLGCYVWGEEIMSLAFGAAYNAVSSYLWIYALLTTLFACANVFVYYNLSLKKYEPVFVSVVFGLAQIIFVSILHDSIMQVLIIQLLLMAAMLLVMSGMQLQLFRIELKKISKPISPAILLFKSK